jgi:hypothetical protein
MTRTPLSRLRAGDRIDLERVLVLRLERLPIGDEIAQLRDAIGLRQTRPGNPMANLPPRSPGKLAA